MKRFLLLFLLLNFAGIPWSFSLPAYNQPPDTSITGAVRQTISIEELEQQRLEEQEARQRLQSQIEQLQLSDSQKREELEKLIEALDAREAQLLEERQSREEALRNTAIGYPVLGPLDDTIFTIYTGIGSTHPRDRATGIGQRIRKLFTENLLRRDTLVIVPTEYHFDIMLGDFVIVSISETDALWYNDGQEELAIRWKDSITESVAAARKELGWVRLILRIGLVLLLLGLVYLLIRAIGLGYRRLMVYVRINKSKWLKDLAYKDYTFLTAEQEFSFMLFVLKITRWVAIILLVYLTLPLLFSIFPATRDWADNLLLLIWSPFSAILLSVWNYLPNLFTIVVIYFVMRYVIRFVGYVFSEIEAEKLNVGGFHADWASPTYSIIRFLLYAFMFVLIFPYLPGSDSQIFQGVSVFIGILFSLGSSTAIANMVAGLVITYMRPFKIGDRIKIADTVGIVLEKTLLVTRIRNVRNEIITIPNSSVLSGNTVNYTTEAASSGLVIHTSVTIGYDVPWRETHQALIDAALKTNHLLKEPQPFVWQTSLDDFYVSYQLNAYTQQPNLVFAIYSELHQNIQDIFNERGIEIMSPHYRAERDGNPTTIPAGYLKDQ